MSSSAQTDSLFHGRLRTGSRRLFWVGLAMTLLGVAALIFPVVSTLAVALTLMMGLLFMFQGAVETYFALEMRPQPGWAAMLLSAIASIVVAALIVAGWPAISLVALGVLTGVNFISTGLGYVVVSRMIKPST